MIKYVCDKCDKEITNRNGMVSLTVVGPGGSKKVTHYCSQCVEPALALLSKSAVEQPVMTEDVEEEVRKPEPVSDEAKDTTSFSIDSANMIKDGTPIMNVKPINDHDASLYLVNTLPGNTSARRSMKQFFKALIGFYRGATRVEIMQRAGMSALDYNQTMHRFVSLPVYKRWFDGRVFFNEAGDKIHVGEVLSFVEASMPLNEIVSETNVDNKGQVIEILEYYTGVQIGSNLIKKYVLETGGHE